MNRLSRIQQAVVGVAFLIIGLMCVYPPWTETKLVSRAVTLDNDAGYAFLFSPPYPFDSEISGVTLNVERLGVQVLGVIAVAGFAVISFVGPGKKKHGKPM